MGKNYYSNKAAIDRYIKELEKLLGDISEIDKKVLNKAVNVGLAEAKRLTPVGVYPKEVNFTTKDGKNVSFRITRAKVGGHMRRSWSTSRIKKSTNGITKELFNTAEYASYVNYGHRIVIRGITKGFVPGKHILERAINKTEKAMISEFKKVIKEVKDKHDC